MGGAAQLRVEGSPIQGLEVVSLPVHRDERGWFKENWQREKMVAAGLPDFRPVQNNVSFNGPRGTTRGLHAEPWDKYISVLSGEIFGVWVDLRPGHGFGSLFTAKMGEGQAVFVPRGVANAFQTLASNTVYSYLVTEHWTEAARLEYSYVNLADPDLDIPWPISLDEAIVSQADKEHPPLAQAKPVQPKKIAVLGGNGQLGRAFAQLAKSDERIALYTRAQTDLQSPGFAASLDLANCSHVVNAAAMTSVDRAQTPAGSAEAWQVNAVAVRQLAARCGELGVPLVHVSTDYVFDGAQREVDELHPIAPLGVYGQSKAAGEQAVLAHTGNYVVRTSWVIGQGNNFVSTMRRLAEQGIAPRVVDDQVGRLTFASELARGIMHLLDTGSAPGIYHLQGGGEPASWYQVAREVFALCGHDPDAVQPVSTREYALDRPHLAPRPVNSTLDTAKLQATGFAPKPLSDLLDQFLGQNRVTS
ncbi:MULTISPECIES: bifunctional dTDP-4-dehydrorhamnose 3,5-epimerase family protein/NAD(P)-dependent oxidoreductase [Micrococcaceae]|uniref:sugar nucleotide-binding protein n=1 Tax=Micrococcaceae TaxID=1268 RepID=UPI001036B75D|nr:MULTISPECIES: bifunctional dTDP-4-dehydrorhamnose 3,5-epimerase family protein/NAD(P)-dependent oxidoreductase [Micrococcaceae]TAP27071.1 NAD-dependent epimerase/dehydratase family protein [Arthrobacter sp. S41]UXN31308.1 bifunctional dTDP-4-dehydrorhamnose 3,5-epimerase family protein/NAD(P)-dependent oxidoreductase [Glutamicibacter sp. M10]